MKHNFSQHIKYYILPLIFFISVISACTPEKWHRTMTFFFDGVPDSSKTKVALASDSLGKKDTAKNKVIVAASVRPGYNLHPPYKEKQCDVCHDKNHKGEYTQPLPDLCYTCHTNYSTKYKFLHGPVASGACVECHSPHMSKYANLQLREGQELCFYCHSKNDIIKTDTHKDIGETNCTECHNPHGGDDKYILR